MGNSQTVVDRSPAVAPASLLRLNIIDLGGGECNLYFEDRSNSDTVSTPAAVLPVGLKVVGVASGTVSGSGTTNTLPIWTNGPGSVLGDSVVSQSGGNLIIAAALAQVNTGYTVNGADWSIQSSSGFELVAAGAAYLRALSGGSAGELRIAGLLGFATGNLNVTAPDASISRLGAAALAIGNGSAGSFAGSLKLTSALIAGSASGVITIQGAAAAGTWTFQLPVDDGTPGQFLQTDGSGVTSWQTVATTAPSGVTTNIQFNDAGAFGGDAEFTWDKTGNQLGVGIAVATAPIHVLNGSAGVLVKLASASATGSPAIQFFKSTSTDLGLVGLAGNNDAYVPGSVSGDLILRGNNRILFANNGPTVTTILNNTGKVSQYAGSAPTNGQLLIGNTAGGTFDAASLTAGTGITITPGGGSITIAASSGGVAGATGNVQFNNGGVFGANANFTWDDADARLALGIGTVTPPVMLVVGDTITTSPRGIMSWQSNNGAESARFQGRKSRGTFAAPTVIVTGDVLTRWIGAGYDGTNYLEMASVEMNSTGTIAATRVPTTITFRTATDATPSVLTTALLIGADQSLSLLKDDAILQMFANAVNTGLIIARSNAAATQTLVINNSGGAGTFTSRAGNAEGSFIFNTRLNNTTNTARLAIAFNGVTEIGLASNTILGFASTASAAGTIDTALTRISAGLVGMGTGGAGSFAGSLKLTGLEATGNILATGATSIIRLKGYTVATLPAGTQGDTAFVTDALAPTFLATIVGGGAVVTPVFYNGTNWVGY